MGLRKKLAVVAAVVVLGAGSVSANMPVIDISSIMTSIQQFVTNVGHMKQEVMKWTNEAKKALKAAQAISKGDFRSFVQGVHQMNALVAKYANLSDGMRDVLADEDATGAGLVSLFDKFEGLKNGGGEAWLNNLKGKWDEISNRARNAAAAVVVAWNSGDYLSAFNNGMGYLDVVADGVMASVDDVSGALDDMADGLGDMLDPVLHQWNAVAKLNNKFDKDEDIEKRKERIKKLCEEVATLTEEIGVALSNGQTTEVAQKCEQRDQKLKEIEDLKSMNESAESFKRGMKAKVKKSKKEMEAEKSKRIELAENRAAKLKVIKTYTELGGLVADLPYAKSSDFVATPGEDRVDLGSK